uniref:ABC transporter domain-containing protein n=1 Tax=Arundo donax TaxID=35708 RepID=A0A0A9DHE8_ARUDO
MVFFRYPSSVSLCCAQEPQFLLPPRPPAVSRIFPLRSISHPPATHLPLPATAAFVPGSSPSHWDVCLTLPSCIDERSSQPLTLRPGSSKAPFSAMLAAGTAVAVPTAAYYSPVKPVRRWRSSWRCRAARVKAGYSQLEVRKVTYRPPGTEQNLLNEISLSLPEKSFGLIFGRSGSGKTTLLQLLARLSEPTSGTICIQKYDDSGKRTGLS